MLDSWNPGLSNWLPFFALTGVGLSFWLPVFALIGVPTLGTAVFRLAQHFLRVGERQVGSITYGVAAVFILLVGVLEWGIVVDLAVWAPKYIASHPEELWRRIEPVAGFIFQGGLFCGLGAHAICTRRRLLRQPKSP